MYHKCDISYFLLYMHPCEKQLLVTTMYNVLCAQTFWGDQLICVVLLKSISL